MPLQTPPTPALIQLARTILREPELRGLDADEDAWTAAHGRILARKRLVQTLFTEFCQRCIGADERYFGDCSATTRLELGSGTGIMNRVAPAVITSEVKAMPYVDLQVRAEELPFRDGQLRAVYAINVFHHVSDPRIFFQELTRALAPGGGIVMIEPYYGLLAQLVFKHLFTEEGYDLYTPGWPRHHRDQLATGTNQALSYIVLKRDRARWEQEFPGLELVLDEPHTHLSYLISGGLNFRQLMPDRVGDALRELERAAGFVNPLLALQHTLVVRKRPA